MRKYREVIRWKTKAIFHSSKEVWGDLSQVLPTTARAWLGMLTPPLRKGIWSEMIAENRQDGAAIPGWPGSAPWSPMEILLWPGICSPLEVTCIHGLLPGKKKMDIAKKKRQTVCRVQPREIAWLWGFHRGSVHGVQTQQSPHLPEKEKEQFKGSHVSCPENTEVSGWGRGRSLICSLT